MVSSRFSPRIAAGYLLPIAAAVGAVATLVCLFCWATALGVRRYYMTAQSFDYDVRDYGAKGDGVGKDTAALQAAIEMAAARGGGVVILPPGRYLSGTIHLRNNVSLRLCGGAALIASADDADFDPYETPPSGSISRTSVSWTFANKFRRRDASLYGSRLLRETIDNPDTTYAHYSLILGDNVSNVSIEGSGTIDGNRIRRGGPKLIALKNCHHITVRGLTLRNAPSYNISLIGSEDVDLENLRLLNGYADGIDPDDSRFVRIANCYIDTWDDAICAKASLALGRRLATEDLVVTNCILITSNNGFKFGTESEGDLRNVTFSNCVVMHRGHGRAPITGIAIESVDGGRVDGVVVSNVVMRGVRTPIFLRLGNRGRGMFWKSPGEMRDITISNIVALDAVRPSLIDGLPGFPIRDVTLANITVSETGSGRFAGLAVPELPDAYPYGGMFGILPAYSLYARHVDGLSVSNWRARWDLADLRPAAVFDDVSDLQILGLHVAAARGPQAVALLNDVNEALIEAVSVAQPAASVVQVEGNRSRKIDVVDGSYQRFGAAGVASSAHKSMVRRIPRAPKDAG